MVKFQFILLCACVLVTATVAQNKCISNFTVCNECPQNRRSTLPTGMVLCCPDCGEMTQTYRPGVHQGHQSCLCPPLTSGSFRASNWTASELTKEGKVLAGERPPLLNSIVNSPIGQRPQGPIGQHIGISNQHVGISGNHNGISSQLHAAISVMAEAIESLAVRMEKLEQKVDRLHDPNSINRVGLPHKKIESTPSHGGSFTSPRPLITSPNPGTESQDCPSKGFQNIDGTCYYISVVDYKRANWQDASDDCSFKGSKLVNLERDSRRRILEAHLSKSSKTAGYSYWLGGLYPGVKWLWVDTARTIPLVDSLWSQTAGKAKNARLKPSSGEQSSAVLSSDSAIHNITKVENIWNEDKKDDGNHSPLFEVYSNVDLKGSSSQTKSRQFMMNLHSVMNDRKISSSEIDNSDSVKADASMKSYSRSVPYSRSLNPWDIVYGRCLLFHPINTSGRDIFFRYTASQCGYKNYYICEKIN